MKKVSVETSIIELERIRTADLTDVKPNDIIFEQYSHLTFVVSESNCLNLITNEV
jgi:hypothetical protein